MCDAPTINLNLLNKENRYAIIVVVLNSVAPKEQNTYLCGFILKLSYYIYLFLFLYVFNIFTKYQTLVPNMTVTLNCFLNIRPDMK